MVRGEHHHGGFRVTKPDPVSGQENPGRRAAVIGLSQHVWPRSTPQFGLHVSRVAREGDHDGTLGRNEQANPVEGLAEKGPRPDQSRILLRTIVTVQTAGEAAQAHAFTSRQDNGPEVAVFAHR